jgi:hypothetical protein
LSWIRKAGIRKGYGWSSGKGNSTLTLPGEEGSIARTAIQLPLNTRARWDGIYRKTLATPSEPGIRQAQG